MIEPHEITQMTSSPAWSQRLAAAHTVPREMRAEERYRFDAQRFRALRTPVLLLLGSDSPESIKAATRVIDAALPNSRIVRLPGQQHTAMYAAPDLFLREVLTFLSEP